MDARRDEMDLLWVGNRVRKAMRGFADDWDRHRRDLIGSVRELEEKVTAVADTFRGVEAALVASLKHRGGAVAVAGVLVSRPCDWWPLSERDPLPGDPDAMAIEAVRLRTVGAEMRAQIDRLRGIATDPGSVGEHADALRVAAGKLAGQLEKTVGRYEGASEALREWSVEAADLQSATVQARAKALDAEAMRTSAPEQAEAKLQEARGDLMRTLTEAEVRDRHFAHRIDQATDDDIEDGHWGNFKGWVDRNAGWIKEATKWLGHVATVVGFIAIFIPGLNMLAIGLMFTVLVAHSLLAASGNGSWADVGIDVFALATFGVGMRLASGVRAARAATRTAGTRAAGRAAERAAMAASRPARLAAGRVAARGGRLAGPARASIRAAKAEARVARFRAAREFAEAPLAKPTWAERFAARDFSIARDLKDTRAIAARFPGSAPVAAAADDAERLARAARTNWHAGFIVDTSDKAFEAGSDRYRALKDRFVGEVGSTW